MAVARGERCTRIKSNMEVAGNKRVLREALVLRRIRHDKHLRLHDRVSAKRLRSRRFLEAEPKLRLEPLTIGIDQTDQRNWHAANERGQLRQFVETLLRLRIENFIGAQRGQAF